MKQQNTYVTVAFDGWTNCTAVKVTNVMAISKGVAYYLKSIPNPSDHNTAGWLAEHMKPLLDELKAAGIKVNAIVTDNGSTETAVRKLLCKEYNLVSIPCAAHTIQLIDKFVLDKSEVDSIIKFFKKIVSLYLNNIDHRLELKQHTQLKLRKYNETRQNTVYFMLERLIEMKAALNAVSLQYPAVDIDDERWLQADDLITILKPFQMFTRIV